ncbi:MAG: hypothetical protein ACI8SE_000215 [Bacteroidia bacterium]|jgi:hypothetical protein
MQQSINLSVVIQYKLYICAMSNRLVLGLFLGTIFFSLFSSCKDDNTFLTNTDATLNFSSDTVFFDTVFASNIPRIPLSVNHQFVVVNPYSKSVKTNFKLSGGNNSVFRINVDGEVGPEVNDILIRGNDSVFVFVELSVDPNNDPQSLPLIVRDSIQISTNGNQQNVQLIAWGQDAHYFLRDTLCDAVLDDKVKPYVVHSYLYVPENCTLTIKEGVKMHFAPRSWLYVEGTLIIEGTKDEKVRFEGDRLQPQFEEVSGQWGGIWLDYLSKNNSIKHAEIKNGTVGIYCDSSDIQDFPNSSPNVIVENTEIRNMSFDGLSGKTAYIEASNSVFTNCGRYTFLGLWGGRYDLKHCNFTTYNFDFSRRDPTFALNNVQINEFFQITEIFRMEYDVQNCIIDGGLQEEVSLGIFKDVRDTAFFGDTLFNNNLARTERKFVGLHTNNIVNISPAFVNILQHDYHIQATSGAIDIGVNTLGIQRDFDEVLRNGTPDAGAFEYQP